MTLTFDSQRTYLGLDFVRLSAALMVALYHLGYWWWVPGRSDFPRHREVFAPIAPFVSSGWVGVPIFFVISGFVIAFSASQKDAVAFICGRALRLYPAAWVCATITMIVAPSSTDTYLRSITLSPVGPWVSAVYWTLGVEIVFYALVAFALWLRGSEFLPKLGIALGLYSCAFWGAKFVNALAGRPLDPFFGMIENTLGYLLLLQYGVFFAVGMMFFARRWALAAIFAVVASVGVGAQSRAMAIDASPFFVAPLVWLAATAIVVACVVWNDRVWAMFGKWSDGIRILGLMTYPLYLVHNELGHEVMMLFSNPWVAFGIALATVLMVSFATVPAERNIRLLFRGFGARRPRPES